MEATTTIRKGNRLGSGSFGHVFRAVQSNTHDMVAVKQSRASLHLKRPLLQHEARVLKILAGHPGIPEVYAYGRIEHFELMSMQLLHRSLRDIVQEGGPLSVKSAASVACQMIDVLSHVHSHGLAHRDIKPGNIMLHDSESWKICLIDFGFARPMPSSNFSTIFNTNEDSGLNLDKPAHVLGTLPFASLNAHEKNLQLTLRDDLESLAYSLLWLLRGSLPWSYYAKCGTRVGRIRQVLAQKKRHTGSTLANGLPGEFGTLVDYARSMSFDEKPDYGEWRRIFEQVDGPIVIHDPTSKHRVSQILAVPPEPPVKAGYIVLIKLDPSVTADGFTIREGHESSYIPDPIINGPEWSTVYRPAVVTQVEWDKYIRKYSFLAVAISRRSRMDDDNTTQVVPILTAGSHISSTPSAILIEPEWPPGDSYFYVFRRPMRFYCLPSQEQIHSTWRVSDVDCDTLLNRLSPPPDMLSGSRIRQDLKSPNPDIRHDARLRSREGYCGLYVQVQPLTLAHFHDDSIDWFSGRAWFDECVKAARYQNMNDGIWWTGAWFPAVYQPREGELSDSYWAPDYSMWEPQEERRKSLTLGNGHEDFGGAGASLAGLVKIVGLEQESEAPSSNP